MKALSSIISLSVAAIAMMSVSAPAISSTIGDLKVTSYVGQPFNATLTGSKGLSADCLSVVKDDKVSPGLSQLSDVKVTKGKKAGQFNVVGWKAETSPVMLVTVKNDCGNGTSYKSYQVILNPDFDTKKAESLLLAK